MAFQSVFPFAQQLKSSEPKKYDERQLNERVRERNSAENPQIIEPIHLIAQFHRSDDSSECVDDELRLSSQIIDIIGATPHCCQVCVTREENEQVELFSSCLSYTRKILLVVHDKDTTAEPACRATCTLLAINKFGSSLSMSLTHC